MQREITNVSVVRTPIRLGQFLKLANLVQDGVEAKIRIQHGEVQVNGIKETRRGRQLAMDDVVEVNGLACRVSLQQE